MSRNPDWWCSRCSFKVFGSKDRCGKCGTVAPHAAQRQQAQAQQPAPTAAGGRPGDYMCPNCQLLIYGSKPCCAKCGFANPNRNSAPAPVTVSTSAANAGGGAAAAQQQQPPPTQEQQAQQPAPPARRGLNPDWVCRCGDVVFGSRPNCRKCGSPSPHVATNAQAVHDVAPVCTTTTSAAPAPASAGAAVPECNVCLEPYNGTDKRPMVLPCCGTSICDACWRGLLAHVPPGGTTVSCVMCREAHPVNVRLIVNRAVLQLLE